MCGHLAVQAERAGFGPVALIDTDPQGSLADWWNARAAETPVFIRAHLEFLDETLDLLSREAIRYVFMDTPPAVTDVIRDLVRRADLVVVPTRPSPHDLRAVGATVDIIAELRKPMVFALNDAAQKARITADAAVALSQHGTVAPVTVHHRMDFVTSMIDGRTVMETNPQSRSAEEIVQLWAYLESRLDAARPRTTVTSGVLRTARSVGFGRRRVEQSGVVNP